MIIIPNLAVILTYTSTAPRNNTLVIAKICDHVRVRRSSTTRGYRLQLHGMRAACLAPWLLSRGGPNSQARPPQAGKLAVGVRDRDAATSPRLAGGTNPAARQDLRIRRG